MTTAIRDARAMRASNQRPASAAWTSMFAGGTSFYVTLTFNWRGDVRPSSATSVLRDLSYKLDSARLGGRFYEFGVPDRTLFLLIPEKLDSYPHYHGLVMAPDDTHARQPQPDFPTFLQSCWKLVAPGGSFNCQPLRDVGALNYATKETDLNSDLAVCSFQFWSHKSLQ